MRQLLHRVLGGPVESSTFGRLWAITLGNALFLRELVTGALEQGQLEDRRGVWVWVGDRLPGPRLSEVVHERLGQLDESAERAVRLLALGEPLGLVTLVELTSSEVEASLEERAVVSVKPGEHGLECQLAHPLYAEIVRAEIPRAHAARLIGELLDSAPPAPRSNGEAVQAASSAFDDLRRACWSLDYGLGAPPGLLSAGASAALDLGGGRPLNA